MKLITASIIGILRPTLMKDVMMLSLSVIPKQMYMTTISPGHTHANMTLIVTNNRMYTINCFTFSSFIHLVI